MRSPRQAGRAPTLQNPEAVHRGDAENAEARHNPFSGHFATLKSGSELPHSKAALARGRQTSGPVSGSVVVDVFDFDSYCAQRIEYLVQRSHIAPEDHALRLGARQDHAREKLLSVSASVVP